MKKITGLLRALTLLISCMSTTVLAESTNDNSGEIDALLEQRAELICLERYNELDSIDQQLAALGGREINSGTSRKPIYE